MDLRKGLNCGVDTVLIYSEELFDITYKLLSDGTISHLNIALNIPWKRYSNIYSSETKERIRIFARPFISPTH